MINAVVAFKKAVATIGFKKAIASIKLGDFLIFRFFFDVLGISDTPSKGVGKPLTDTQDVSDVTSANLGKVESDNSTANDNTSLAVGIARNDSSTTADQIDTFSIGKTSHFSLFSFSYFSISNNNLTRARAPWDQTR